MEMIIGVGVFAIGAAIGFALSRLMAPKTQSAELELLQGKLAQMEADILEYTATMARLGTQAERSEVLERELRAERGRIEQLTAKVAQLTTSLAEQGQAQAEKIAALTQVRGEIEKDFKNITAEALKNNSEQFFLTAEQKFAPMQKTLEQYREGLAVLEKERASAQGALSEELKRVVATQDAVRTETSKLVNAMRAAPKTRGRWGEHTLRNVLELAGLSLHCDFAEERSFERDGARMRPDVIVNLPGGRTLVIDAKTSLSAYLDAVEATDDDTRERHLALHVQQIRTHVKQLASKEYFDGLTVTPDFVVMFIPGDNFYTAAAERDASLFEEAAAKGVVIATPATLIALAKAIAYGWRQEKVAENAQKVHQLGRELYKRLSTMRNHIYKCGKSLSGAVEAYNGFIGSLESQVLPQARRFNELEVEGTAAEIDMLEQIGSEPRTLQAARDVMPTDDAKDAA